MRWVTALGIGTFGLLLRTETVLAQGSGVVIDPKQWGAINPLKWTSLDDALSGIAAFLLGLLAVVALFFFLFNGFRYLLNAGNTEVTGEAKTGMLLAIIGLAIAISAYAILQLFCTSFSTGGPCPAPGP